MAIASTPRSGRDPCAARPRVSMSKASQPRCAMQSRSSVGSATIAASALQLCSSRLRADAAGLLVGHRRDDDIAAEPEPGALDSGERDRREARLHVVGAPAVQASVLDAGIQARVRLEQPDRVEVAVQEQRAAAAGPAGDADHVRPAGRSLLDVDLEPCLLEPLREHGRHRRLATAGRDERRVDRVDRDEPGGELLELGHRIGLQRGIQRPVAAIGLPVRLGPVRVGLDRRRGRGRRRRPPPPRRRTRRPRRRRAALRRTPIPPRRPCARAGARARRRRCAARARSARHRRRRGRPRARRRARRAARASRAARRRRPRARHA